MNLTTLSAVGSDFFTGNTRFRQRINSSLNSSSLSVWRHVVCNVRSEFTSFLCVAAVFCASEKIVWIVLEGLLLTTTPGIVFFCSRDVLVICLLTRWIISWDQNLVWRRVRDADRRAEVCRISWGYIGMHRNIIVLNLDFLSTSPTQLTCNGHQTILCRRSKETHLRQGRLDYRTFSPSIARLTSRSTMQCTM